MIEVSSVHDCGQCKTNQPLQQQECYIHTTEFSMMTAGPDSIEVTPILVNLAATHLALGVSEQAFPLLSKAYGIRSNVLGEEHAQTRAALKWINKCTSSAQPATAIGLS